MKMQGIAARFDCAHGEQYEHIGAFWDAMRTLCPEQVLFGVGYGWENDSLGYLIGTPEGVPEYALEGVRKILPQAAFSEITLPDDNWKTYTGTADTLDELYAEIYRDGPLDFEIEQFDDAGNAVIQIHRSDREEENNMKPEKIEKERFSVIGRLGSTKDGEGFIQRLWQEANAHFGEIEPLVKRDENGVPAGFWGAMSDCGLHFEPWKNNFTEGLYLAGAEVRDDAEPPAGWTKWTVPGFVYLRVRCDEPDIFPKMLRYMEEHNLKLAGAVHDFNDPAENGQGYMYFPIEKL